MGCDVNYLHEDSFLLNSINNPILQVSCESGQEWDWGRPSPQPSPRRGEGVLLLLPLGEKAGMWGKVIACSGWYLIKRQFHPAGNFFQLFIACPKPGIFR